MTNKKRLRVGSDEYTIDLERRVNSVEAQMKDFLDLLREKDNRITELEAQLKEKAVLARRNRMFLNLPILFLR